MPSAGMAIATLASTAHDQRPSSSAASMISSASESSSLRSDMHDHQRRLSRRDSNGSTNSSSNAYAMKTFTNTTPTAPTNVVPSNKIPSTGKKPGVIARSKSAFGFGTPLTSATPVQTTGRRSSMAGLLSDENSYCMLSEEGMEVLAEYKQPQEISPAPIAASSGKRVKRSPSFGNLLKTPSRLNLKKMPSKLKLFSSETPLSRLENKTPTTPYDREPPLPTLSPHHPVPAIPHPAITAYYEDPPSAKTPSSRSSKSTTSSFFRTALRREKAGSVSSKSVLDARAGSFDGKSVLDTRPASLSSKSVLEGGRRSTSGMPVADARPRSLSSKSVLQQPVLPGTVAAQIQRFEDSCIPDSLTLKLPATEKTPAKNTWLNRLPFGKALSSKKKQRLAIPTFDSPSLSDQVTQELRRRSETESTLDAPSKDPPQSTGQLHRAKPSPAMEHLGPRQHESALTTVRGALAPPAIVEPAGELPSSAPQQRDRLSVAYLPTSRLSPQATSKASRDRATLVASSPLSGDLHIAASPSRGNDALQRSIKSIEQEQTQRLSVFLSDNDASFTGSSNDLKQSDRPRSEPVPLKSVFGANLDLQNLLDRFEDTFNYANKGSMASLATTFREIKSTLASTANGDSTFDHSFRLAEMPADLQDLLDAAQSPTTTTTSTAHSVSLAVSRPLSSVSSFEGNASTAQEAIAIATVHPAMPVSAAETVRPLREQQSTRPSSSFDTLSAQPSSEALTVRPSCDTLASRPSFDTLRAIMAPERKDEHAESEDIRVSIDSGRSSFDYPDGRAAHFNDLGERAAQSSYFTCMDYQNDGLPSYYNSQRRNSAYTAKTSTRSSLRSYLAMERPTIGDRMLEDVDEAVVLAPISRPGQRYSLQSAFSESRGFGDDRTAHSSLMTDSVCSEGTSLFASPTPANGMRQVIGFSHRHSLEPAVGESARPSIDSVRPSFDSIRPSFDSDGTRPAMDSDAYDSSSELPMRPRQRSGLAARPSVKQSTQSSLFDLSSANSSPCPRPPRRKLLMLTGNRLPKPPVASNILRAAMDAASPQIGRVRQLKDSWEAKISPVKEQAGPSKPLGPSPRFVRPLPGTLGKKVEVARPTLLSNLSNDAIVPPDTPPPSSPSASELSFGASMRSSIDSERPGIRFLNSFNRKRKGHHRRQSSSLSRHSILSDTIPEEPARKLSDEPPVPAISQRVSTVIEEQTSPIKGFSPLLIRKRSHQKLSMGRDAFQPPPPDPGPDLSPILPMSRQADIVEIVDDSIDWEQNPMRIFWARFCQEAVSEVQKSRAQWPDTEASLHILEAFDMQAFHSPKLSSPLTPVLTSPENSSALVSFILDSQSRYRSDAEASYSTSSPDVPCTPPALSPDSSADQPAGHAERASKVTPESPTVLRRQPSIIHQPRPLMLIQKHCSQASTLQGPIVLEPLAETGKGTKRPVTVLTEKTNAPQPQQSLPRSKKGYKPKGKGENSAKVPFSTGATDKVQLSPLRKNMRVVAKRTFEVHPDENTRQVTNAFLTGRKLSVRRRDAFTAAKRKLEGLGSPDEQTDKSSGESSSNEGSEGESKVLESAGAADAVDTSSSLSRRPRPRPSSRRLQGSSLSMKPIRI